MRGLVLGAVLLGLAVPSYGAHSITQAQSLVGNEQQGWLAFLAASTDAPDGETFRFHMEFTRTPRLSTPQNPVNDFMSLESRTPQVLTSFAYADAQTLFKAWPAATAVTWSNDQGRWVYTTLVEGEYTVSGWFQDDVHGGSAVNCSTVQIWVTSSGQFVGEVPTPVEEGGAFPALLTTRVSMRLSDGSTVPCPGVAVTYTCGSDSPVVGVLTDESGLVTESVDARHETGVSYDVAVVGSLPSPSTARVNEARSVWVYPSEATDPAKRNGSAEFLFTLEGVLDDGGGSGDGGGGEGGGGGLIDDIINRIRSLLRYLFVPSKAFMDSLWASIQGFYRWGPVIAIEELQTALTSPAGSAPALAIPVPRWTQQSGWVADPSRDCPIPLFAVSSTTWFPPIRLLLGAGVWLGFIFLLASRWMPKQTV